MVLFGLKEPVPPLHAPPEATVTLPFRAMLALLAHTEPLAPAFAVGEGVKLNCTGLLTARQLPLPVLVRVSTTAPLAISPAVGV